jgi:hypothetical protein
LKIFRRRMLFRTKKPEFNEIDGEYVVPVRFTEDLTHNLLGGWWPIGFGWAHLRPREDGSFDLFIRQQQVSEDLNLVKFDAVSSALMAALDLANAIDEDEDANDEVREAASAVKELVKTATE